MATPGQSNYGGFVMTTTTEIVARNKAKGTDFCRLGDYLYIIRSDLGCYMKAHHDPHSNDPVKIYPLDPNCAWGDHYMATPASNSDENRFYIIRGDDCHVVTDLSTGAAPTIASFKLHEQCRGGDFYLTKASDSFFVIKSSRNKYLSLNSLTNEPPRNSESNLPVVCRECQYYWASSNHFHYLKPTGLEYYQTQDLGTTGEVFPINSPVKTFLRGGLVMTTPNQIVSHNQAKGTDICRQGNYLYIIRSDLGIFVRAFHERDDNNPVTIHPLDPNCAWGDHYMATPAPNPDKNHFYIIRGDDCHVVTDLSTGAAPTTLSPPKFKLHEQCRGGDFYLAKKSNNFYVIKSPGNKYLHLNSLTHSILPISESNLSVDCRECQYYWATEKHFYFLKCNPSSLECHQSKELNINSDGDTSTALYSSAATFLPVMATKTIVPRNKAKGTDFCGQRSYQYIIRSDLGCYMKAYHVRDGDDPVTIHPLHPTCAWGDHYLATPDYFYIIKGDVCRRVKDLRTGADPEIFPLHDKCKPNSGAYPANCFYTATNSSNFYIIRSDNSFLHVKDMSATGYKEKLGGRLHDECRGGVYYWATKGYFYFLKEVNNWSLGYYRTEFLFRKGNDYPVYPPITKFLPGGLAVIMGPTFAKWKLIKTIDNMDEDTPLKFSENISLKNGYKKEVVRSIQQNWYISTHEVTTEANFTTEKIVTAAFKQAFSLPREHGGCKFDCTEEDWTEEQIVKYEVAGNIPKGKCVYIWQLKLGIGEGEQRQDVFFTSQVKMTYSPNPPPIETQHQPEGNTETQNPPPEACTETARRSRTASL